MKMILVVIVMMLIVQPVHALEEVEQAELECALHMSTIKGIVHERYNNNVINKKEGDKDAGIRRVFDILDREKGLMEALTVRFGACFADKYLVSLIGEIRIRIY